MLLPSLSEESTISKSEWRFFKSTNLHNLLESMEDWQSKTTDIAVVIVGGRHSETKSLSAWECFVGITCIWIKGKSILTSPLARRLAVLHLRQNLSHQCSLKKEKGKKPVYTVCRLFPSLSISLQRSPPQVFLEALSQRRKLRLRMI